MKQLVGVLAVAAMIAGIAIVVIPVALVVGAGSIIQNTSDPTAGICAEDGSPSLSVDMTGLPEKALDLTAEQIENVAIIMAAGEASGLGARAQLIGIMTAMQESTLQNLAGGDRDSIGLFQQRPSQGWGNPSQLHDPVYAARAFFEGVPDKGIPGLKDIEGWESMPLTAAAQAVQISGYPDAYAKHEAKARELMSLISGAPIQEASEYLINNTIGCDSEALLPSAAAPDGLPTQAQLTQPSADVACPDGTTDLGAHTGGFNGAHVPLRLCSIPDTVCTGSDCAVGELGGKARGEVVVNSLVAPHFIAWLNEVRAAGYDPTFTSSFRSWSTQQRISRNGTNPNAADPGYSNHQMGAAIDIAGLPGVYDRHMCTGHTADGACKADTPAWDAYWKIALKHGAAFHHNEFWHMEWVITRPDTRQLPFLQ